MAKLNKQRQFIAIDLKSFYASVECRERGLDPLTANLVVADAARTEKTICLAVSPSLKAFGIPGRPRLFEVVELVRQVNSERLRRSPKRRLTGESFYAEELARDPSLAVSYIVAPPRMALYIDYSARIYGIYLKYVSPEDIHVYSVDEVFIDATDYLDVYGLSAHDFAMLLIREVLDKTGITATAGIGTNLYLCKVAMDIVAKKMQPDRDGVRIAELDEMSYRKTLWDHTPLTDFWRIGRGYSKKLEAHGMFTMGDIARRSLTGEDLLYKLFGVNAELLIDHAWGWEPVTIADIKAYKPESNSLSSGQVLKEPYDFGKARLIVREMTDQMALDLVDKGLATRQMVLTVGYDVENISNGYEGEVTVDHYGRTVPKHAHGTANLDFPTSSTKLLTEAVLKLYDRIVGKNMLIRRINIAACNVIPEADIPKEQPEQLDFFTDYEALDREREKQKTALAKEKSLQKAVLGIKKKYGKNAVLKGMNFEEGATAKERNQQIGGHKA